ncbi:helix-turn-helix domain-containing protein [Dactylosporangium sp. CA-092794]|uniref:helix-turn-helix domain-containing protein n=1 Tax=Dactylosporangium sp. CA-092794 TaxID=3239929 RepID=UPI003D8FBCC6
MSPDADHDPQAAGAGFAATLRARRLARGLTQDELATHAGLGVRTLRELERGRVARPQRNTVALLADALDLTGADREAFLTAAAGRPPLPLPLPLPTNTGRHDRGTAGTPHRRPAAATFTGHPTDRNPGRPPTPPPHGPPAVPAARTPRPPGPRSTEPQSAPATLPLPTLPPLIGRDADIAELLTLIDAPGPTPSRPGPLGPTPSSLGPLGPTASRAGSPGQAGLIALIGMAGVGKTGLAHAVAHAAATAGWTAVSVTVTNVSQPTDIFSAVAAVFGVARADELADRYATRPALLVLDGIDRSPRAAIEALLWLRARVPAVRILVTSRRPIAGELPGAVDWQVQPLELPGPGDPDPRRAPAVALFVERLRMVRREPVRDDELPAVAELVRRLDGLPLAIELAAARGRVLELPELLSRYGNRVLDLAPTDPAGRRLRDAVAASYQLLGEREQAALRRLSTFRGRWSVELAEALLDGVVEDVEAVLDRLVGLGLVSVRGPGDLRFRLLDVVGDFAAERCAREGELRAARLRHAEVVTRVAVRVSAELTGPDSAAAVSRLDYLNSDMRTALRYTAVRDPEIALRLAGAIPRWCRLRGRDVEAHRLLRRLLEDRRTRDCDPAVRARAQVATAMLASAHGQGVGELYATEAALQVLIDQGDIPGELTARALLSGIWQALGGETEARRHSEAVLALAVRTGRGREVAVAQNNLAWHDIRAGDLATAARRLSAAARRAGEAGDPRIRALAQANLAEVARLDGRFDEAVDLARTAATAIAEVGDPIHRVRVLGTLGQAFAETGRPAEAAAVLAELSATPGSTGTAAMIEGYLALARADHPTAARSFETAANLLAGRDDVRDVLEALTGLAATTTQPRRDEALKDLAALRDRTGLALLPREHRLLNEGARTKTP